MNFELPLEKIIREQREREARKSLTSLLATKSPPLNTTFSIPNPFLKALSVKRKVFVSFHHRNDQAWFNYFTKTFAEQYDIIHDKSLGNEFIRSNELEREGDRTLERDRLNKDKIIVL